MARKRKRKKRNSNSLRKLIVWLGIIAITAVGALIRLGIIPCNFTPSVSEVSRPRISIPSTELELPAGSGFNDCPKIESTRSGYSLLYNLAYRIPEWVAWELTGKELRGDEKRTNRFIEDPDIPSGTATNSDYKRSGYDRGHMAPAGDMVWSTDAMRDSFYFSNICPQDNGLNGGVWKDLEELCRKWARADSAIYIVCGPMVEQGYKTIGENRVVVPQRFFKVILSIHGDQPKAIGFIFQNQDTNRPLIEFVASVDSIEQITGWDFFALLPDDLENDIECSADINQWSWTEKSRKSKRR